MFDQDTKAIGERLQIARKKAGFDSATEAAAALGIPYATYAGHENGTRGIGRAGPKYARRYKVSLDWLTMGKGPGPGENGSAAPTLTDDLKDALADVSALARLPKAVQDRIANFINWELENQKSRDTPA